MFFFVKLNPNEKSSEKWFQREKISIVLVISANNFICFKF